MAMGMDATRKTAPNMKATKNSWLKNMFSSPNLTVVQLQTTAAQEGAEAQNNLGILLMFTERFAGEAAAAADCFRRAAEQGHTVAQYNLALSYQHGRGVSKDANEAQKWFLKAAEEGDASAQHYLGVKFHRDSLGERTAGTQELQIEALKWLLLAAAKGHHNAERSCEPLMLEMNQLQTEETNRRVTAFNCRRKE
jgi:TPR repeat protein